MQAADTDIYGLILNRYMYCWQEPVPGHVEDIEFNCAPADCAYNILYSYCKVKCIHVLYHSRCSRPISIHMGVRWFRLAVHPLVSSKVLTWVVYRKLCQIDLTYRWCWLCHHSHKASSVKCDPSPLYVFL